MSYSLRYSQAVGVLQRRDVAHGVSGRGDGCAGAFGRHPRHPRSSAKPPRPASVVTEDQKFEKQNQPDSHRWILDI